MKAVKQSTKQQNAKWNRLVKRSESIKSREYELTLNLIAHTLRLPKFHIPKHLRDEVTRMVRVAKQLDKTLTKAEQVCDQLSDLAGAGQ